MKNNLLVKIDFSKIKSSLLGRCFFTCPSVCWLIDVNG